MSHCVVPKWNLSHERQEQVEEEEGKRSFHVPAQKNHHSTTNPLVPFYQQMEKHGVTELTWQNGQLALHGIDGLHPTVPTKPTWSRANDTLESVVNQANLQTQGPNLIQQGEPLVRSGRTLAPSGANGKWVERGNQEPPARKRTRSTSDYAGKNVSTSNNNTMQVDHGDHSVCGSASAAFCRDNDTTLMTWASFDSARSMKTKSIDEDSACHVESENQEEEQDTKRGANRSHSARRSRAAAIHNQSERRRRDRINEKMKALQKLVPNASKTDKASMLDEVIEYLKQLQAQVQFMSVRSMQQMIMPIGMQQQLQMSLLARMGMGVSLGMGMGMLDMSGMARPAPQSLPPLIHPTSVPATPPAFVPPHFLLPHAIPRQDPTQAKPATNDSVDPFCAFLAQTMNMDIYNKMAAFYRQQVNQTTNATSSPTQSNNVQGN